MKLLESNGERRRNFHRGETNDLRDGYGNYQIDNQGRRQWKGTG